MIVLQYDSSWCQRRTDTTVNCDHWHVSLYGDIAAQSQLLYSSMACCKELPVSIVLYCRNVIMYILNKTITSDCMNPLWRWWTMDIVKYYHVNRLLLWQWDEKVWSWLGLGLFIFFLCHGVGYAQANHELVLESNWKVGIFLLIFQVSFSLIFYIESCVEQACVPQRLATLTREAGHCSRWRTQQVQATGSWQVHSRTTNIPCRGG